MNKILVITHGELATGLKQTLGMFIPLNENISFISFDGKSTDNLEKEINEQMQAHNGNVIALTDIVGGTPFQTISRLLLTTNNSSTVVGGINLPMLIEAMMQQNNPDISAVEIALMETAHAAINSLGQLNAPSEEESNDGI